MPDQSQSPCILITGATGYIGRRLTSYLLRKNNHLIRLLIRNKQKILTSHFDKVEIVEGSTFTKEELALAVDNVDTAFYLIHSMGGKDDYQERDRRSAENFRDACIKAGVKRIIYLGGLGVEQDASKHLLSRIETGKILSANSEQIQTIWLRAGVIIGSGSGSFEIIRNLCQKLPIMITPKWVRTKTQPIGIDDVISYLAASIDLNCSHDLIVDIGTDPLSFQEMMEKSSETMGLKRYLIPVPLLSPKLSSYWLILFTPVPFSLALALVEGLKSETTLQNKHAQQYYPQIEVQPFQNSVDRALSELAQNQVLSRWCDSSGGATCDIKDFDNPVGAILRDCRTVLFEQEEQQLQVFKAACSLGGENGWFRYNIFWKIRGLIDKFVGGYGLNRGRRVEKFLRIGDAVDFWKVADIKEGKRLLFYAQMKVPGQAWLEFDVWPDRLIQTAHFIPKGIGGRLYWYAMLPFHTFIFQNLANTVVQTSRTRKFPV